MCMCVYVAVVINNLLGYLLFFLLALDYYLGQIQELNFAKFAKMRSEFKQNKAKTMKQSKLISIMIIIFYYF